MVGMAIATSFGEARVAGKLSLLYEDDIVNKFIIQNIRVRTSQRLPGRDSSYYSASVGIRPTIVPRSGLDLL